MGYRSNGKIYLSDEALAILPKDLKRDLEENWENENDNTWAFYGWKWYNGHTDVDKWNNFMDTVDEDDSVEYGFIRVGEEYEDVEVRGVNCYEHLGLSRTIEIV